MQPAIRSSNQPLGQPLGGTSGDWRHRFLRFHAPLALASAVVLVLFMTLPPFDPQAYPQVDMSGGVIPQQVEPMDHGGDQAGTTDHGGDQAGTTGHGGDQAGTTGHGRGQTGPMDDSGDQAGSRGHGGDQTGPTGHGGDQTGSMDDGGDQAGSRGHGGDQTGPMDDGGSQTGPTGHGGGQTGSVDDSGDQSAGLTPIPDVTQRRSSRFFVARLTRATGYVATGLLALTLLIGPANLLLRKRNPVSNYLRRDTGTWTAIFSVVHVIFGLQLHSGGQISRFLNYFVVDGRPLTNTFGLGNWTGLAATVIVVGLLALSNDFALRKLKVRPWKWLQRLNYALFALVIAHAFFYGALLRVTSPFTLLLALSVIAVFVGQAVGVWLWRQRHARTAARLA